MIKLIPLIFFKKIHGSVLILFHDRIDLSIIKTIVSIKKPKIKFPTMLLYQLWWTKYLKQDPDSAASAPHCRSWIRTNVSQTPLHIQPQSAVHIYYIVMYTGKVGWCSVVGTLLLRVARQFITIAKALFKLSCSPNS